ncbi:hypothetical protein, partial [Paracoccus sp. PAR01]|uniref:hypothetical protein n=1 Tax=Paracoccus sp. PAR01 TaxID=2769282 RepID=UPI001CE0D8F7
SAPDCSYASWWSCTWSSPVCSWPPAIMLDSRSESLAAFAQQGRNQIKGQSVTPRKAISGEGMAHQNQFKM